jgi:methylmalonyl-CoA mutase C-terminal domain/subunit
LSILSGAHDFLFPRIMELLKEREITEVLVIGGGIIPEEDIPGLKEIGIAEIFGPGTNTDDIVAFIKDNLIV